MIRLCFLLGSAMVSIRLAQPNTRTLPSQSQKQLSTHTDGQMTNLLDTLTIYRSVVSLSPEEAGLTKCCESTTLTPHLDLLVILARDINAWFSYASKTIFSMLSDSKDFPPCLPEVKAPTTNRGGGGGPPSPPSPPSPPPQSSPSAPDSPSNTQATHHHHRPRPTSPPGRGLHPTNPTSSPVPLPLSDAYVGERNQPSAYQPPPSEQTHLSTFARAHEPMSYPKAAREDYRVTSAEQRLMQRRLRLRRQRKLRRRRTVTRMKMRKKQRRFKRGQKDAKVTSLQLRKSRADRHFGPGFWLLLGLSVGLGAAFVCHTLLGRKEVVPVIIDDSEEHPHEGHHYWRKKRNQTGHNRRAWVNTSDNVYDRNESVSKRIRRLRSHLYRRRRQEIQYAVDLFPIDSGAIANSSESAKSQDLGSSNSSNQTIRDDRDVLMMVDDLVRTLPRSILKNGSKGRYRRRHGRKGKKGKGKRHHANDEVISSRRPRPGVEFATSSGSSETSSGELLRPVVDRVRPDGTFWDDSDEYSEAHSVGKLRSGATSTCSSLRDELTGPWVSTSHSFVVYDLDVIDDIPNEVMEVLCCDEQTCDKHPHDRYHYVGNKIIVQRLPLPGANNGRAGITAFLPNLNIPPLATSTPKKTAIISESFLELGVAWALQHTVNRISSKGDNIANVNLNGLNTADAARTDIKNASF
ncbi:uncharacterized protein [Littorina saxatilis]|uniref:uncharacterized protein n=1 Tax=Littorina saxatilis TaxID=31220 RepID=UPI0038B45B3E